MSQDFGDDNMGGMANSRLLSASVRIASLVMPTDSSFKVTSCDFDFLSAFLQLHRRSIPPLAAPHEVGFARNDGDQRSFI